MAETTKKKTRVSFVFGREITDDELKKLQSTTNALTIIRNVGEHEDEVHHHHEGVLE